jgi:hypothetical protein
MPTRLTGQIEHITCTNEESGFTIAKESESRVTRSFFTHPNFLCGNSHSSRNTEPAAVVRAIPLNRYEANFPRFGNSFYTYLWRLVTA